LLFIIRFLKPHIQQWLYFSETLLKLRRIFSLNKDIFFRTIILISILAFITAQGARQGDLVLAANAILIQLFFFLANAIDGFANAAESRTGELIGESKQLSDQHVGLHIRTSYWIALQQGAVFLLLCLILLWLFSDAL